MMITFKSHLPAKKNLSLLLLRYWIFGENQTKAENHVSYNTNTVLYREPKLTLTTSFDKQKTVCRKTLIKIKVCKTYIYLAKHKSTSQNFATPHENTSKLKNEKEQITDYVNHKRYPFCIQCVVQWSNSPFDYCTANLKPKDASSMSTRGAAAETNCLSSRRNLLRIWQNNNYEKKRSVLVRVHSQNRNVTDTKRKSLVVQLIKPNLETKFACTHT